jgi:hypothetical protein
LSLKKDVYQDNERIVIVYNSSNQKKLIDQLLIAIDIPDFFVIFETTDNCDGLDFSFGDSFCIYPWINLLIDNLGDMSPCCLFAGTISNISNSSIKDVYLGDSMRHLRKEFLDGNHPSSCSACWKNETVGIPSMRQVAKHKFKEIYYKIDYKKENFNNLQIFDLKMMMRNNYLNKNIQLHMLILLIF